MSVKLLTEHHLEFLRLKVGCTDSSESIQDKMPHCWKSHAATDMCLFLPNNALLNPHSTGQRFRYAHGDLGFSLKLLQIAAEA